MSYISWNSTSISNFFSTSLRSNNANTSMYNAFGELSSIKSGAYKKLLNAYYNNKTEESSSSSGSSVKVTSTSEYAKELTEVKEDADSLAESATTLVKKGESGLFGSEYDREKITDAVKSFVKDYNSAVGSAEDSDSRQVRNQAETMVRQTDVYKESLNNIGITIDEESSDLVIDEKKFASADIEDIRKVFNGNSSFAYVTARSANQLAMVSAKEATAETYMNNGKYNTSYIMSSFVSYM